MPITLPDARHLSDEALQVLRLRALRGLELGFPAVDRAALLGVCPETISRWWTADSADGAPALPGGRTGRPVGSGRALSEPQAERLRDLIDTNLPEHLGLAHAVWTRRAVRALIRAEFALDLAERTVGLYLRRWGSTSKKPARRSRSQDPDAVQKWLAKTYPAIEELSMWDQAEILWADEVGVAADHHPGRGYARRGERATMAVPGAHIRVNQISAISNTGAVRVMTDQGSLTAAVFLVFLNQLIAGAARKIILITDRLPAHKTAAVNDWVAAHADQIAVCFVPADSPELNPVEYLNKDMNGAVNKGGLPRDRATLHTRIVAFMNTLTSIPSHVMSYFRQPDVHYASAI